MQINFELHIILPLVALVTAIFLILRAWRHRDRKPTNTFLLLISALAIWSLAAFMENASLALSTKVFWIYVSYFGICTLPLAWLVFTLQYTNREKWITRRNIAILAILPVITLIIVWTNNFHHLMWKEIWLDSSVFPPSDDVTHNTWFWVNAAYSYSLLIIGTINLFSFFKQSSGIYRKQLAIMLLGTFAPWAGNALYIAGFSPFSAVDPTPLAFAITGIAFYWGLSRFHLMDVMPIAHDVIFKSISDGVIVLDTQQRVIDFNPAAQHIIELTRSVAIGRPLKQVLPQCLGIDELKCDTAIKPTLINLGEGSARRYYELSISIIEARQRINGYLVLLRDETERKERTRQLEEAVNAAKAANQAKSNFLASMSHELRTPLNAILGFTQVLQEQLYGALNEQQQTYTNNILTSGQHLLSLINDILDISKIEAGKTELELSTVRIDQLIDDSLVTVKEKALHSNVEISVRIPPDIARLEWILDERKIKQVIFNLLSNAVKFTPKGGRVTIDAQQQGGHLTISITDTGIGIPPKYKDKLFTEFYQIQSGLLEKTPGTGLGLSISKKIVEMHHGKIWVESEGADKGSRFSFKIPSKKEIESEQDSTGS